MDLQGEDKGERSRRPEAHQNVGQSCLFYVPYDEIDKFIAKPINAQALLQELSALHESVSWDRLTDNRYLGGVGDGSNILKRFTKAVRRLAKKYPSDMVEANLGMFAFHDFVSGQAELTDHPKTKRHLLLDQARIASEMFAANIAVDRWQRLEVETEHWYQLAKSITNTVIDMTDGCVQAGPATGAEYFECLVDKYDAHVVLHNLAKYGVEQLLSNPDREVIEEKDGTRLAELLTLFTDNVVSAYFLSASKEQDFITAYQAQKSKKAKHLNSSTESSLDDARMKQHKVFEYLSDLATGAINWTITATHVTTSRLRESIDDKSLFKGSEYFRKRYSQYVTNIISYNRLIALLEAEYLSYKSPDLDIVRSNVINKILFAINGFEASADYLTNLLNGEVIGWQPPYTENNLEAELERFDKLGKLRNGPESNINLSWRLSRVSRQINGKPGETRRDRHRKRLRGK